MAVKTNVERKAVEISWDPRDHDGDVIIEAVGEAGDVHTTLAMPNDGYAPLSYPADFTGESKIRVLDAEDPENVIDEGSISVE